MCGVRKHSFLLIILCIYISNGMKFLSVNRQYLQSPCPQIFEYRYDTSGLLNGYMRINSPTGNIVQVDVEFSVGNNVEGYNGQLELVQPKQQVIEDVIRGRPIEYKVFFPIWRGIPPKITKIMVNGNLICSGPKISMDMVPVLTTINLRHTLRVNVTPLFSSPPSSNEGTSEDDKLTPISFQEIPPAFDVTNNYDLDIRQGPLSPSGQILPKLNLSPTNNQFNFNPTVPKNGLVPALNFGFNPEMPNDTTKVYFNNPFLSSLTTTTRPPTINFNINNLTPLIDNNNSRPNLSTKIPNSNNQQKFNPGTTHSTGKEDGIGSRQTPVGRPNIRRPPSDAKMPLSSNCGTSFSSTPLIFNGNSITRGAYPWLVAIFAVVNVGLKYQCSASLISNKHIVTAAHCVTSGTRSLRTDQILMVIGKINIQKWGPGDGGQMIEARKINVHPDYEQGTADADIAVVVLNEHVNFTRFIKPICLWNEDVKLDRVVGEVGVVVGWGQDETGAITSEEPKESKLPIVSQEQCLRSSKVFFQITSERTFCAGYRNRSGPCKGDSGSGFILKRNGKWHLKGIVSIAIRENETCDLTNYLVFTDASKFTQWILSFLK